MDDSEQIELAKEYKEASDDRRSDILLLFYHQWRNLISKLSQNHEDCAQVSYIAIHEVLLTWTPKYKWKLPQTLFIAIKSAAEKEYHTHFGRHNKYQRPLESFIHLLRLQPPDSNPYDELEMPVVSELMMNWFSRKINIQSSKGRERIAKALKDELNTLRKANGLPPIKTLTEVNMRTLSPKALIKRWYGNNKDKVHEYYLRAKDKGKYEGYYKKRKEKIHKLQ